MNYTKVESSNLSQVAYDATTETLGVIFHRGGEYRYEGVPKALYDGMLVAPSTGQFFIKNIKNNFTFVKVSG